MNFELVHTFDCDVATFEKALFDNRLPLVLERTMASVQKIELLSSEDDGRFVKRRIKYVPSKMPLISRFTRGLEPEKMAFIEESTYDRERHHFEYRIFMPHVPPNLQERFTSRGSYSLTDAGGKVRRVVAGEVTIKLKRALLRGLGERVAIAQVKKKFDQEAIGLRSFLCEVAGEVATRVDGTRSPG